MPGKRIGVLSASCAVVAALVLVAARPEPAPTPAPGAAPGLWKLYDDVLVHAKYVDLTHTITPAIPVWRGFNRSHFMPATNALTGKPYTYAQDGFEATHPLR